MLDLTNGPDLVADMEAVFKAIPRAKYAAVVRSAAHLEIAARTGYAAAMLLDAIRTYILHPATNMGGEQSPFVAKIDGLVARPEGKAS